MPSEFVLTVSLPTSSCSRLSWGMVGAGGTPNTWKDRSIRLALLFKSLILTETVYCPVGSGSTGKVMIVAALMSLLSKERGWIWIGSASTVRTKPTWIFSRFRSRPLSASDRLAWIGRFALPVNMPSIPGEVKTTCGAVRSGASRLILNSSLVSVLCCARSSATTLTW